MTYTVVVYREDESIFECECDVDADDIRNACKEALEVALDGVSDED